MTHVGNVRKHRTVIVSGNGNIVAGGSVIINGVRVGGGEHFQGVVGSGNLARETRELPGFSGITVASCVDVQVSFGTEQKVEVEADDNLLALVETSIVERPGFAHVTTLNVGVRESLSTDHPMVVHVTMAHPLVRVEVAGSGDVGLKGVSQGDLDLSIRGSGNIRAAGEVVRLNATVQGSGDMKLRALSAAIAQLDVQGSGDITATVTKSVIANVRGSGDITILGDPPARQTQVYGSGDIEFD